MQQDLTTGSITGKLLRFAFPLMVSNLLQQCYNIADTWIVGRFLGADALAGVGSAYTLMVFLTSILLGLCMGSGAVFSLYFGKRDETALQKSIYLSFLLIGGISLALNFLSFLGLDFLLWLMRTPAEVLPLMKDYLWVVFWGICAVFLYNYFSCLLRGVGNSLAPLVFLGISTVTNILLDLLFVVSLDWGVQGAAAATVLSQWLCALGIGGYTLLRFPPARVSRRQMRWDGAIVRELSHLSLLTCLQQSVMNFGILMVQGLVNSFGAGVMAAFAAGVKIDSFAYMPVQDFGNAFSTFIAQNHGAGKQDRIRKGIRMALLWVFLFCLLISALVFFLAPALMGLFIDPGQTELIAVGVEYLRIEGACYLGIGILFLLYGYYRAIQKPAMSLVLTVISLGSRVSLAYALSALPFFREMGIWLSVPLGWLLADITGIAVYLAGKKRNPAP